MLSIRECLNPSCKITKTNIDKRDFVVYKALAILFFYISAKSRHLSVLDSSLMSDNWDSMFFDSDLRV